MVIMPDLIDVRLFQTMLDRLNEIYSYRSSNLIYDDKTNENVDMQALDKAPVLTQVQHDKYLALIQNLIDILADATSNELKEPEKSSIHLKGEKKYRLLFENITQGFASHKIILDVKGQPIDYVYLSINKSFEKLTGLMASVIIGKTVKEIMPKTEKYWIDLYGKVALTGEAVQYENYSEELGKYFEVWAFCPQIGEFATVFTDITKRKRDEEIQKVMYSISRATSKSNDLGELIEMIRNQLGKLIDVTNFYIALYDETSDSFTIPYYSDEKDDITSFPAGKSLSAQVIKTKTTLLGKRADMDALINTGIVDSLGEPAKVWLGLPLMIKEKPIGVFVLQSYDDENAFTQEDVSMLEFVSRQISISIQQKKTEQELKSALEKAEESDRLKTSFLANMSHELRTPMNGIMGFAELLDDDELSNEERHEYITVINDSSQSLLNVITNIVDVSKIDSKQIQLRIAPFNVNSLLDELLKWFKSEKVVKDNVQLNIELVKEIPVDQFIVISDQTKIRHIFSLLLNNAGKFTNSGFIRFGYSVMDKHIQFFVQDTGKGISAEKQCIIFEKFRQEDETLSRKYGGVGLGLTIAKGLVELIGGKIWVDSEPGKGTTFFFEIPEIL